MGRPPKTASGIGSRIASLYEGKMTRREYAKIVDIPDNTLGNYVRGDRKPDIPSLLKLQQNGGADIQWLLTGEAAEGSLNPATLKKLSGAVSLFLGRSGIELTHEQFIDLTLQFYPEHSPTLDAERLFADLDRLKPKYPKNL